MIERMLPSPTGLAAEFYAHAARGELRFQRCEECSMWRHPPRRRCASCGSTAWSWERSSARGRVFTWTVSHRAFDPAFADAVPYAVVVVELDEGPRVVCNLRDLDVSELALDLPVDIVIEKRSESIGLLDACPRSAPET